MAYITLQGRLVDAQNNPIPQAKIKFRATATSYDVLQSTTAIATTDGNGEYDLNLNYGRYEIALQTIDSPSFYVLAKNIVVNSDVTETELEALISNFNEVELLTPAVMIEIRSLVDQGSSLLQDTIDAKDQTLVFKNDAAQSAAESLQYSIDAADNAAQGMQYLGTHDASTGSFPDTTNLTQGAFFEIITQGDISGTTYRVGDGILFNGTDWLHLDNTESVTSVAGKVGDVVVNQADVGLSDVRNVVSYSQTEADGLLDGKLDSTANAVSATKLLNSRAITIEGDASGTVNFDGTSDVTITVNVSDSDNLGGIPATDYITTTQSDYFDSTSTYPALRAQGTTAADVGLDNVLNVPSYSVTETDNIVSDLAAVYEPKRQHNFSATSAPTANDDSNAGYQVLSKWVDINTSEIYVCIDATAGAAVWDTVTLSIDDLGSAALIDVGTASNQVRTNADNEALFTDEQGANEIATDNAITFAIALG